MNAIPKSAITRLSETYPPCYTCGAPWLADSEAEAVALLEQNEWYKTTIPKERRDDTKVFVSFGWQWRCQKCMFMSEAQRRESERAWRHGRLIEDTYGYGRMPRAAILHNFTQSTLEAESQNAEAWQTARQWVVGQSLWIQGPKGTGKTFMGRCLLNEALDDMFHVYEVNAVDFCEWVYRQGEKQRREVEHVDVLLLDDVDKPEWRIDSMIALWKLLDVRHRDKLTTVITSNVSPESFRGRLMAIEGDNRNVVGTMIDRMHGFKRVTLEGGSLR